MDALVLLLDLRSRFDVALTDKEEVLAAINGPKIVEIMSYINFELDAVELDGVELDGVELDGSSSSRRSSSAGSGTVRMTFASAGQNLGEVHILYYPAPVAQSLWNLLASLARKNFPVLGISKVKLLLGIFVKLLIEFCPSRMTRRT